MEARLENCLRVMKQINDLGIPTDYPPRKELSMRLSDYVKTGDAWAGKIKFECWSAAVVQVGHHHVVAVAGNSACHGVQ